MKDESLINKLLSSGRDRRQRDWLMMLSLLPSVGGGLLWCCIVQRSREGGAEFAILIHFQNASFGEMSVFDFKGNCLCSPLKTFRSCFDRSDHPKSVSSGALSLN
jgi:hypothetical protein